LVNRTTASARTSGSGLDNRAICAVTRELIAVAGGLAMVSSLRPGDDTANSRNAAQPASLYRCMTNMVVKFPTRGKVSDKKLM